MISVYQGFLQTLSCVPGSAFSLMPYSKEPSCELPDSAVLASDTPTRPVNVPPPFQTWSFLPSERHETTGRSLASPAALSSREKPLAITLHSSLVMLGHQSVVARGRMKSRYYQYFCALGLLMSTAFLAMTLFHRRDVYREQVREVESLSR